MGDGTKQIYRTTNEVVTWLGDRGLRLRPQTLINWRHVGSGPLFHRFGHRVVYAESDLVCWVQARLGAPLSSTSDSSTIGKPSTPRRGHTANRGSADVVGKTSRASAQRATVGTRPQLKRSP